MNEFDENENYDDEFDEEFSEESTGGFSFKNNNGDISDNIKTWIIVGIVAFITFILVFIVSNMLVNGGKKKNNPVPEEKPAEKEKYEKYKIGDAITLKDDSTWHVLYESKDSSEYVTILSDEDVNTSNVLYGNVNSFLKGTYKSKLVSDLKADFSEIQETRMLAYLDLANISSAKSSEFEPEVEIKKFDIPEFIYATDTITDTVYRVEVSSNPVMICAKKDDKEARFCLGDSSKANAIRPVIVISKKYIKSSSQAANDDKENNQLTTNDGSNNSASVNQ